jgi:hypothetical protein
MSDSAGILIFFGSHILLRVGGYAGYTRFLNRSLERSSSLLRVGCIRFALGLILGVLYFPFAIRIESPIEAYLLLIPVRFLAWWLTIRLFYGGSPATLRRRAIDTSLGVLLSYALDGMLWLVSQNVNLGKFPGGC